jgi:hypothetical protein
LSLYRIRAKIYGKRADFDRQFAGEIMARDYLDLVDNDFDNFFNGLIQYVTQKCGGHFPEWTHIPSEPREELSAMFTVWHNAYETTIGQHTPLDTEAKNKTKTAAKAKIRPFVNVYLREGQPAVTDLDRTAMRIPNKDTTPTHHPVPHIKPETEAVPSGRGKHTITVLNPETKNKKKPSLVKGVAFAYKVRNADHPKYNAEDMPSTFQIKTVRDFQWTEADYGKVCDYAAAYENETGQRGPWSDVTSLIIT